MASLEERIMKFRCKEKLMPHYFGRLIHAFDIFGFGNNEGNGSLRGKQSPVEDKVKCLLIGADLKHVLRTVAGSVDYKGKFVFKLSDSNPHIQARNWVLLNILLQENHSFDPTAAFSMAFYSLHLDKQTFLVVKEAITKTIRSYGETSDDGLELSDPERKVLEILKLWSRNISNLEDQETLKESMEKTRKAKISAESFVRFHSDFMGLLLMSENRGIAQAKASNHWMVTGDFGFAGVTEELVFPNVLLTCVNPLNEKLSKQFYPGQEMARELEKCSDWIDAIDPFDDLIFAPHAIDSPFQDWDFAEVAIAHERFADDEFSQDGEVILEAFEEFMQDLAQIFRDVFEAGYINLELIIPRSLSDLRPIEKQGIRFDRIVTGITSDIIGTTTLLNSISPYLNLSNPFSCILTHHRVWRMIMANERSLGFDVFLAAETKLNSSPAGVEVTQNKVLPKVMSSKRRELCMPDPWLRTVQWRLKPEPEVNGHNDIDSALDNVILNGLPKFRQKSSSFSEEEEGNESSSSSMSSSSASTSTNESSKELIEQHFKKEQLSMKNNNKDIAKNSTLDEPELAELKSDPLISGKNEDPLESPTSVTMSSSSDSDTSTDEEMSTQGLSMSLDDCLISTSSESGSTSSDEDMRKAFVLATEEFVTPPSSDSETSSEEELRTSEESKITGKIQDHIENAVTRKSSSSSSSSSSSDSSSPPSPILNPDGTRKLLNIRALSRDYDPEVKKSIKDVHVSSTSDSDTTMEIEAEDDPTGAEIAISSSSSSDTSSEDDPDPICGQVLEEVAISSSSGSSTSTDQEWKMASADEFLTPASPTSSSSSSTTSSGIEVVHDHNIDHVSFAEEVTHLSKKHEKPYAMFARITKEMQSAGEDSEDGGGGWHKYVSKGLKQKMAEKKLSKSLRPTIDDAPDASTSDSGSDDAFLPTSPSDHGPKLSKHKKPYNFAKVEAEDGGGGWHKYISRGRKGQGKGQKMSKGSLHFSTGASSSSSSGDETDSSSYSEKVKRVKKTVTKVEVVRKTETIKVATTDWKSELTKMPFDKPNIFKSPSSPGSRKTSAPPEMLSTSTDRKQKMSLQLESMSPHKTSPGQQVSKYVSTFESSNEILRGQIPLKRTSVTWREEERVAIAAQVEANRLDEVVISATVPVEGETPVKGEQSVDEIRKQFETTTTARFLASPTTSAPPPLSPVSVRQMVNSYHRRMRKSSSPQRATRKQIVLRKRSATPTRPVREVVDAIEKGEVKKVELETEEVEPNENMGDAKEIPIGRPIPVYDSSSSSSSESDGEGPPKPVKTEPKKDSSVKKPVKLLEVVETKHDAPRKSSLLTVTKPPARKRSVTIIPPVNIKEESSSGEEINLNDEVGNYTSSPIDIGKLKMDVVDAMDLPEMPVPPRSPRTGRAFQPDQARPPTPPNVSHRVKHTSPPKTPPSTPAQ